MKPAWDAALRDLYKDLDQWEALLKTIDPKHPHPPSA
jgi:hypothetical protein